MNGWFIILSLVALLVALIGRMRDWSRQLDDYMREMQRFLPPPVHEREVMQYHERDVVVDRRLGRLGERLSTVRDAVQDLHDNGPDARRRRR